MDTIANFITIIRNGYAVNKKSVIVPYSKMKMEILDVLKKDNYIKNYKDIGDDKKKPNIKISLKYIDDSPAITRIRKISKQGQRIYAKPSEFKTVLPLTKQGKDYGLCILTTSSGVMTTAEAKNKKIGGELILEVY